MPESSPRPHGVFDSQSETLAPDPATSRPPSPHLSLEPGSSLGGYRLRRLLGRGGMGEVYEAEDLENGRHVALKILTRGLGEDRDRARFLREGRLAASISHPNTVYVFGTGEAGGLPIITMELASGGTLRDRVAGRGPMPPRDAVDAILQVCAGLQAAEGGGVLHRDIKPSNCFIDAAGTVKVGDFGLSISTLARDETRAGHDLTLAGSVIGTPAFASPEQLRGQPLDVRADIYSVSATLYYLLTGRAPFEHDNLMQLLTLVAQSPAPPPRGLNPAIPAALERVILRGLAKRPQDRFASYRELVAALEPFRSGAVTPATLGRRVLANVIDRFLLYAASSLAGLLVVTWLGIDSMLTMANGWWTLATAGMTLGYFAIAEGWWGASPGKALFGLRVADAAGHEAARGRVIVRSLMFALATNVTPAMRFRFMDTEVGPGASLDLAARLYETLLPPLLLLILFCLARARNGYAGLHELATGTRVVAAATSRQWRTHSARAAAPDVAMAGAARVGPYQVVGDLGPSLQLGYDDRLQRHVWIRSAGPDEAPLDAARRDLARPARLRWLAGRRQESGAWDAFEAPAGRPLAAAAAGGRPWRDVREWLHDLAGELAAGLRDESLPDLSLDRVWISPDNRARLLDWPAPGQRDGDPHRPSVIVAAPIDAGSAQRFLAAVADAALGGPAPGDRPSLAHLPLGARAGLERLRHASFDGAEAMALAADRLVEGPAEVSRRRRALPLAIIAAPIVVAIAMLLILSRAITGMTSAPWMSVLGAAEVLDELEQRQAGPAATAAGDGELRALRIYASRRVDAILADPDVPALARSLLTSNDAASLQRARRLFPNPADADVAAATPVAERLLKPRSSEGVFGPRAIAGTIAVVALVFLIGIGCASVVLAVVMREGPLFRMLDLAIVNRSGERASRWRAAARAAVAWAPIAVIAFAAAVGDALGPVLRWIVIGPAAAAFLFGAVHAIRHPRQGIQDSIAGTMLTPR